MNRGSPPASKPSMPWTRGDSGRPARGHGALWSLLVALLAAASAAADGGPAPEAADAPELQACVEAVLRRVQERYEGLRSLRARFEQRSVSVALGARPGDATLSRGSVAFAKPGRMRWSYEEPEPSLVLSDGETLWIYDPEAREAQRLTVTEGFLSGAAIQFLMGEGDLAESFDVAAQACDAESIDLELLPREPATYERLRMRVDPATAHVVGTTVIDLLGNRTEVRFSELELDFAPEPGDFHFDPPEGVRVIDLDLPSGAP